MSLIADKEVCSGATPDYAGNAYVEEAQGAAVTEELRGRSQKWRVKCDILIR